MNKTPLKFVLVSFLCVLLLGCATSQYYFNETYSQAKSFYEEGNYASAETSYQKFIKENPDSTMIEVAMYYLADSYRMQGKKEQAKKAYQKLIEQYKKGFWVDIAKKDLDSLK